MYSYPTPISKFSKCSFYYLYDFNFFFWTVPILINLLKISFHVYCIKWFKNIHKKGHKASLGEMDSSLFKWRPPPFSKGGQLQKSKNTLTKLRNLFLQNHFQFQQTWHNASLGDEDSNLFNLFKWSAPPFFKGR